ncbi:hypothetical protein D3C85_753610 [compost metagenome]
MTLLRLATIRGILSCIGSSSEKSSTYTSSGLLSAVSLAICDMNEVLPILDCPPMIIHPVCSPPSKASSMPAMPVGMPVATLDHARSSKLSMTSHISAWCGRIPFGFAGCATLAGFVVFSSTSASSKTGLFSLSTMSSNIASKPFAIAAPRYLFLPSLQFSLSHTLRSASVVHPYT